MYNPAGNLTLDLFLDIYNVIEKLEEKQCMDLMRQKIINFTRKSENTILAIRAGELLSKLSEKIATTSNFSRKKTVEPVQPIDDKKPKQPFDWLVLLITSFL